MIQCDASLTSGELIACGRHRVYDTYLEETKHTSEGGRPKVYVMIVIHTPRNSPITSFIGFQTNPWVSYHIDTLFPSAGEVSIDLSRAENQLMSTCFKNCTERVHFLLPAAASRVIDIIDPTRGTARLQILQQLTDDCKKISE